jgi:hypothetical protein
MRQPPADSPFIPGARVAIKSRYVDDYTEAFVDKVHKSGNFTLKGSPQQWRPWRTAYDDEVSWSAVETGGGWSRRHLKLWDESTDAEIKEKMAATKRRQRFEEIKRRLHNMAPAEATDAMLDQIEAALPKKAMP